MNRNQIAGLAFISIILVLALAMVANAVIFKTVYNPFTGKLDYYSQTTSTDNATFANITLVNGTEWLSIYSAGSITHFDSSQPINISASSIIFDDAMIINTSSGYVGINTTRPTHTINALGSFNFTSPSGQAIYSNGTHLVLFVV